MNEPVVRKTRQWRKLRKAVWKTLREAKKAAMLNPRSHTTRPNRKCGYETVEEEK